MFFVISPGLFRLDIALLHLFLRLYDKYHDVELSRFAAAAMGIVSHIDARVMIKNMDEFEY